MPITDSLTRMLRERIREVPDFPKPGIGFKDITPVLADHRLFGEVVEAMAEPFAERGITHVAGIESRGFILASPIAQRLGAGFTPIRKRGKLPYRTLQVEYDLEYGKDSLEVHVDAFAPGAKILIVDDVLATGGTANAACELVERAGAVVGGCSFLLALGFLPGVAALAARDPHVLVTF